MLFTYFGPGDPLDVAFYNTDTHDMSLDIVSASASRIVVRNPSNGVVTTISGTGLPTTAAGVVSTPTGTVTGWTTVGAAGSMIATVSSITWPFAELLPAMQLLMEEDDSSGLLDLLSRQPVTFDASGAVGGTTDINFAGLTSDLTILTSEGSDSVHGGDGDDTITVVNNIGDGDTIQGSAGDDRYVFQPSDNNDSWVELIYTGLSGAISVTIDDDLADGSISKSGLGTDTLVNVGDMVGRDGDGQSVAIWGTEFGDSFTVDGGENSWLEILGGRGSDSYNLTLSGDIRLSFCFDWYSSATQGVVLDLAAQTITNDGYGNSESLMLTAGAGRLFIVGTDLADNITGSNNDEVFLLRNGNDTLDGGGGYDRVRYDNSRFTSGVTVDLAAGTASGAWNGVAFTHSLTGIEDVRGSSLADVISGTDGGERFDGRAGNDSLVGNGGSDTLFGGDGTDTLNGGTGDDFLYGGDSEADQRDMINGGDGNDSIDGGWGNDELLGGDGNDTVIGNLGVDRLVGNAGDDVLSGAGGADLLFGNDGNDLINGGWGFDRMNGGAGADRFFHQGIAEHGSDWIQDYSAADGDQLVFGNTGATVSQFRVNYAETANAGTAGVAEAFVIYLPTGQILWALVDGAAQEHINVVLGGQTYDLLA